MKLCDARHPDIVVLAYRNEVRCVRDRGHHGMHCAAPYGHFIEWIEPEKTRGAAKLTEDDAPVESPSDPRHARARPSRWRRLLRSILGG